MHMGTGDIALEEDIKKLHEKERKLFTPLTDEEHAAVEPLNRHERRAALVKMRLAARAKAKGVTV